MHNTVVADRCTDCAVQSLPAGTASERVYGAEKRTFDALFAAILLFLLSPFCGLIALVIKLDSPGPAIFHQQRIGLWGRQFNMLKFRTMCAERRAHPFSRLSLGRSDRRLTHKSRTDPRVTPFGHFLRRTSLDELPQLWNVLRGDMSFVGPRPELPEIVAGYADWQNERHTVTPGITGWWQVNRDENRRMHEATELDIYYVRHRSVRLDALILLRTVGVVLRGVGAF